MLSIVPIAALDSGEIEERLVTADIWSDAIQTERDVSISGVRVHNAKTDLPIEQVVNVIEQKLNPDYPKTTPRGAIGK